MPAPYVSGVVGRVFAVRWRVFTLQALAALREEIAEARLILGKPLVYLSLIPSSPRTFTREEREALASFVRGLLVEDCSSIHHVIDGDGFAASARRSIVTNLAIASADPAAFHTYATLEDALAVVADETGESAEELMAEAAARRIPFSRRA
jgi:hypothetical protein